MSADLLDSVLKGYPIGTFILWKTREELRAVREIGGLTLPGTSKGDYTVYILDGQQRLTSIYAAVKGVTIERSNGAKEDFSSFYVDLTADAEEKIVLAELPEGAEANSLIKLNDLLFGKLKFFSNYTEEHQDTIQIYKERLNAYLFSTITVKEATIQVATEVFTRLNVGGKSLTMFEIMVAKTYDSTKKFDLSEKFDELIVALKTAHYGTLSSAAVLQTMAACIVKDTSKKAILGIDKHKFIREWARVSKAIQQAVEYLRNKVGVPVSELLPYPSMIVPFAYYFFNSSKNPNAATGRLLQDLFWRIGLGERYSHSADTRVVQDIKRIDLILESVHPEYDWEIDTSVEYIEENGHFSVGRAYIKTILCLFAGKFPVSFRDNSLVNINNNWLLQSNSKNYHHFFPKAFMKNSDNFYVNHIVNITLVDDQLNKREIGAKAPSKYIKKFQKENSELKEALATHLIDLEGAGVMEDDYELFFDCRCQSISSALEKKLIRKKTGRNRSG